MVEIHKQSFKSIWRGKCYLLRPFMALNCLSGSQSPFHSLASQSPKSHPGSSSFQTRPSERAAEETRFGGIWPGLVVSGVFSNSMSGSPKSGVLKTLQPGKLPLNTATKDSRGRNIRCPCWQGVTCSLCKRSTR